MAGHLMSRQELVVDLYAGPGGWDEGMRSIGITNVVGIELDPAACETATSAGHRRLFADVADSAIADFTGCWGMVASPPCQAFSVAGKRLGEVDRVRVHELVDSYARGGDAAGAGWADDRSHHAAQPVRWIRDLRPEWVCLEQVPPVLGLWEHIGHVLRGWGYSTWSGLLNAADFGVPQTRVRAFLVASSARAARPPTPTHAEDAMEEDLFGALALPWVSMGDALGWHGEVEYHRGAGLSERHGVRPRRSTDLPAPTIRAGSKGSGSNLILHNGRQENATSRNLHQPAPTIYCSRPGNLHWAGDGESRPVQNGEAAILQGFPPDYPWRGNKTQQGQQIGNAVPPPLAAAVAAAATGVVPAVAAVAA